MIVSLLPRILLLFVASLLFCSPLSAAQETIEEVVVTGNRRIEVSAIMTVIKLKAGDLFFEEKVDEDIKAIFAIGSFTDVKAETSPSAKGIKLTYRVTEKPVVRDILFDGNKALSSDKLKEALDIKPNSIFSQKELLKSIVKIKKLYSDEGYSQAEIEPEKVNISPYEIKLTLKVTEGGKILIRTIKFEGNKAFDDSKLKGIMETKQDWWHGNKAGLVAGLAHRRRGI